MLFSQKSVILLNLSGNSGINCTIVFVLLLVSYSKIKLTLNSWLFQVATDYHIKIKLAAQVSVPLLHFMACIYRYHDMDYLKVPILQDSACWLIVSSWYNTHYVRSLSQIPTRTITNDIYVNWETRCFMAKYFFKQFFKFWLDSIK